MDWIERCLGFAPDNGDGTLELVIMATGLGLIIVAIWKVPRWRAAVFRVMTKLRRCDHRHRES